MKTKNKQNLILCGLFLLVLLLCQTMDFLFVSKYDFVLNQRLIFGTYLNNYSALAVNILVLGCAVIIFFKNFRTLTFARYILMILLAGASSNLIDRFVYGGVIDYIPVFGRIHGNFADWLIVLAVFVSCVLFVKQKNT